MGNYKVPQDVETDDKLVGFLSLKQFIFVVLGLGFGYLAFFFFTKIHPIAAIIWVPPTIICMVLGLYQRKDQPVEIYLASAIRFRLKPHARKWDQEGYEERVIITAPPKIEKHYTKGYNQDQVTSHLDNLSRLMDTRGWASKLVADWQNPALEATAGSDRLLQPSEIAAPAEPPSYTQPVDVQDDTSSPVARQFETKIQEADIQTHQNALRALESARNGDDAATAIAPEPEATLNPIVPPPAQTAPDQSAVALNAPEVATTKTVDSIDTPLSPETEVTNTKPKSSANHLADDEVEIPLH